MKKRLMNLDEVIEYTNLSRSSVYRLMNEGFFPSAIKIGHHKICWVEKEVVKWLDDRIKERDQKLKEQENDKRKK